MAHFIPCNLHNIYFYADPSRQCLRGAVVREELSWKGDILTALYADENMSTLRPYAIKDFSIRDKLNLNSKQRTAIYISRGVTNTIRVVVRLKNKELQKKPSIPVPHYRIIHKK